MKINKTMITMSASLILIAMASQAQAASGSTGSSSIEFMCKAKAKEIAAETYKGCVVENKQAQVERIRKEYQSKLAELKKQYNSELKQLSPKKPGKISTMPETNTTEMPAKKMKSTQLKTEKIDFSSGNQSVTAPDVSATNAQNDLNTEASVPETEIVEIPVQQE